MRHALLAGQSTPSGRALSRALVDGAGWEELMPQEALEIALLLQDEIVDRHARPDWRATTAPGVSSSS